MKKFTASVAHWLRWVNLPMGVLIALLQRTPALRVAAAAGDYVIASPVGQVLRAAFTLATLGAMHSRAGATTFVTSEPSPVSGNVGVALSYAFTYTGTPSAPQSFTVSGTLPPGLSYIPAPLNGVLRTGTPAISGTPAQAGSYTIMVRGIGVNGQGPLEPIQFIISGGATTTAPAIITQPLSQTVTTGTTSSFSVSVTGSPAPTYQWRKDSVNIAGATSATLALPNIQLAQAGSYSVVVTNSAGTVTSAGATLTVMPFVQEIPPAITTPPVAQTIAAGGTVVFRVEATGTPAPTYQWRKDGVNIPGATGATLVLAAASPADAGDYTVVANGSGTAAISVPAKFVVNAGTDLVRLINLSILTDVTAESPLFTLGTVIGGAGTSGTKPLLVRAAGPALEQLGVTSALADPKFEVFNGPTVTSANDNWGGTAVLRSAFAQVAAFPYASNDSKDAATFDASRPAGAYTIQVSAVGGATGLVIAELYDSSPSATVTASTPRLVNVSVLKQIPTGTILTAGFVIGGGSGAAKTVLIRAVGPSLATLFGVGGAMPDPKLQLFSGQTVIATNDNWGGNAQLTTVGNRVGAFAIADAGSRDAILLVTLAPGSYTAQVSAVTGGGSAIVEVYEVP